jgi:RHS repeat-associated protein
LPWGAPRSGSVSATKRNYTGQYRDDTGLLYYHARYYDPVLGRFISPDTLVPDPTDPQDLNRYTYAKNNPMRYTDPTGHCVGPVLIICAVGVGALVVMGGATIATQPTQPAPPVDVAALVAPISQPMDDATLVMQAASEMTTRYVAQQSMALAAQTTSGIAQGLVWYAEATGATEELTTIHEARKSRQSGKEKASDIPSWVKGKQKLPGESGKDAAKRLLDEKYGAGMYKTGPRSEYNKIQKHFDRKED